MLAAILFRFFFFLSAWKLDYSLLSFFFTLDADFFRLYLLAETSKFVSHLASLKINNKWKMTQNKGNVCHFPSAKDLDDKKPTQIKIANEICANFFLLFFSVFAQQMTKDMYEISHVATFSMFCSSFLRCSRHKIRRTFSFVGAAHQRAQKCENSIMHLSFVLIKCAPDNFKVGNSYSLLYLFPSLYLCSTWNNETGTRATRRCGFFLMATEK